METNWESRIEGSKQALVVTAPNCQSIAGVCISYEQIGGSWHEVCAPVTAMLGYGGLSDDKHEGDHKTPIGVFGISSAFGWGGNPGTKLPFKSVGPDDYWVSVPTPNLYNVWVSRKGGPDPSWHANEYERLTHPLYKYAAVINYNMGLDKEVGKGSAIFLHCALSNTTPTEGCVALPEQDLLQVLRWLDPLKNPVIVIDTAVNHL